MQKPKLKAWRASYSPHLCPQGHALSPVAQQMHRSEQIEVQATCKHGAQLLATRQTQRFVTHVERVSGVTA